MMTSFAMLLLAGPAVALDAQDPAPEPLVVRVVGHADGLPRPGVLIHVDHAGDNQPKLDAEGLLIAEDARIRKLRAATTVRTDPNGCATLDVTPHVSRVFVGEPFFAWGNPERNGRELLVQVGENEPVGVRVVDAAGVPLAHFPVALHAAGKDLVVALTDADGKALLGVPKDFTARAFVVPAGWVGPKEGFPSLAESLQGRRGALLQVPPHGSLRIRCVRGGVPVRGPVHAVSFSDPANYTPLAAQPNVATPDGTGLVYEFVGLGLELASYSPFGRGSSLTIAGPQVAGETKVFDVDLGPKFAFRLVGDARAVVEGSVQVRVVTDAGKHQTHASRDGDTMVVDYRHALSGTRLVRVEFDAVVRPAGKGPAVVWSLALPADRALDAAMIDLGEVTLVAHPPQVRGNVTDESGVAVVGATVVVAARGGEPGDGFQLTTDAEGRFELVAPLFRDANGALAEVVAKARHGELRCEDTAAGGEDLTLVLRAAVPAVGKAEQPVRKRREAKGRVVARVVGGVPAGRTAAQSFQLIAANSSQYHARVVKATADGLTEHVFEDLPAGRYALRTQDADRGAFVVLANLDVPDVGDCPDERLRRIGVLDRLRTVTMRVVDAQGVPVAGARLVGSPHLWAQTDGTGSARLSLNRELAVSATIDAPGMRQQRIDEWPDELLVKLEPAGTIAVTVRGLPDDVPRERIEIWVRDEVRERMAGPRAHLGKDGIARMPLPARGRYVLWLLVTLTDGRGGSTWSGIYVDPVPVIVGDAREQQVECKLDEATVVRLRDAIAKLEPPAKK